MPDRKIVITGGACPRRSDLLPRLKQKDLGELVCIDKHAHIACGGHGGQDLAAAAGGAAFHAAVAAAVAGHDAAAGAAAGGVAHVVHRLHRAGCVVDAAVYRVEWVGGSRASGFSEGGQAFGGEAA